MKSSKMNSATGTLLRLLAFLLFGGAVNAAIAAGVDAAGTIPLPATNAGRLAQGWLEACKTHDFKQIQAWTIAHLSAETAKHAPVDDISREDAKRCALDGGYRVGEITHSESGAISLLIVGAKSGRWYGMQFNADGAGRIENAGYWPATPPESTMPKDLGDAAIAARVKALVAEGGESGLFSGIVSVARGTQPIATASAGFANRPRKTPITGSTQFTLGSMGKMFTAASIGQLVDQGKLSFDDKVGKFFPDYPNETVRNTVTVGMLLSHTAGLGDFLGKRTPAMMKNGVKRAAEFMPLFDRDEPQFQPGTNWAYSNAGLVLAGAIVEKVSGEDYPDYLRKHIFAVAGMAMSDPNNIPHVDARMVTPYTRRSKQGPCKDWCEAEPDIGSPAGGAISTADDLIRFADALRNGKLVSPTVFAQMTKPVRPGEHYGYAMEIQDVYGRTVVGHGGGYPGVSTHLHFLLDSPYTIVILANQDRAEDYASAPIVALMAAKAKAESAVKP